MARRSVRELERAIESLASGAAADGEPLVINLTAGADPDAHPELVVSPFSDKKPSARLIPVPHDLPEEHATASVVTVGLCGQHDEATGEDVDADACELWNALHEDDLEREREQRQQNGDPIPDLLTI